MTVEIGFFGAAGGVTGSCYRITTPTRRILVDCGFFQGSARIEELNAQPFPFDPREIDAVVLTHAHMDHCGRAPLLAKRGFAGRLVATTATRDMAEVMLADSARIQISDAASENRVRRRAGEDEEVEPLYDEADATECVRRITGVQYGESVDLGGGVTLRFRDAGHILGAAFAEIEAVNGGSRRRIVFSGDLGNHGKAIIRDPERPAGCEAVILESTYGDRAHKDQESTLEELSAAVNGSLLRGGIVLVPAFALGRTQEVLYHLGELRAASKIPRVPVYVDSPLAVGATEVFQRHPECFDEEMRALVTAGKSPFEYPELRFVRSAEESMALNDDNAAKIIVAGSGMCTSGRILHHLRHHAWKTNAAIVFCGYQGRGTLGRAIVDGARKVRIFRQDVAIRATVHTLGGFSAHADQAGLLEWVGAAVKEGARPFVTHGEPEASATLGEKIGERFGAAATVPILEEVHPI